ncbi:MAG: hypothetical protein FWE03_06205 [Firmicutes bacterium]|nr:hypothetical protein [Bacillota bacterium]
MSENKNRKIVTAAQVARKNSRDDNNLSFSQSGSSAMPLGSDTDQIVLSANDSGEPMLTYPGSNESIRLTQSTLTNEQRTAINSATRFEERNNAERPTNARTAVLRNATGDQISPVTSASTVILENGRSVQERFGNNSSTSTTFVVGFTPDCDFVISPNAV